MGTAFSWSLSRHDAFAACRRKYYYSYYAACQDAEIKRLKSLSALPLWAGTVVHETIEGLLKSRAEIPAEPEREAIIRAAVHGQMASQWRESEAGSPTFRLLEHEYQIPVEVEDKKILVGTVMRSLRNFFRSPTLAEAYASGKERWLTVEELHSYSVNDVEVLLRMDLAFRDPAGQVVIVDWKTGRNEGRFAEVQVAGYALFAAQRGWAARAEAIQTELAYLAVPRYSRRQVAGATLERARDFIVKSAAKMRSLLVDPDTNTAREEDFTRIDRPQACFRCNFRRLCYPRASTAALTANPVALDS